METSVSASGVISNLREQIQVNMVRSIYQRHFLPEDKLHEIFTLTAIKNAVKELVCGPDDRIKLADTIKDKGQRVFAMLIYNDWQNLIIEFRKHGALDNRLPLSVDDAIAITGYRSVGLRLAQDTQWSFCPYVFPEKMAASYCQIEDNMILPLIGIERIGSGGFSDVALITISPSQQNFIDRKVCLLTLTPSTRFCLYLRNGFVDTVLHRHP